MRKNTTYPYGLVAALFLASACDGAQPPVAVSGAGGTGIGGSGGSGGGGGSGATTAQTSRDTRVARLTHAQYNNTVQALFNISDSPADVFPPDALDGFEFDTSIHFRVDARLGPQYRSAAESLAQRAATDDAVFNSIVPCSETDAACRDQFLGEFGQRAFRRPLSDDERDRFSALFDRGPELVQSGNDFRDGVQVVVEAMLQSPQFLYRPELSTGLGSDGMVDLDDWEIASRLSYFFYNSMPDDELFADAAAGRLSASDTLASVVQRLQGDDRAVEQATAFHSQAWQFRRFSSINPDADVYPDAPDDMIASVRAASERFIAEVVQNGGGYQELLTAPYAFADSGLAPLYGASVPGELERIELDPQERKGFLMQVGFLAANAHTVATDPIHRGLFVVRNLLCREIGDPPPGASMTQLPANANPQTTREEVEILTGQIACVNCHNEINPAGFAFEGFDAVGHTRTMENGVNVSTAGMMLIDGSELVFSGPMEVVDAVATSQEAQQCYADQWMKFAFGRNLTEAESAAATQLADSTGSVKELMVSIATARGFVSRAPNEVAP